MKSSNSENHILTIIDAVLRRHFSKNLAPPCERARHLWPKFWDDPLAPQSLQHIFLQNHLKMVLVTVARNPNNEDRLLRFKK